MTTFYLVADLILIFLGLLTVLALVVITVSALDAFRIVRQIMGEMRPLTDKIKHLAATGKKVSGAVQHASGEIRDEVSEVTHEVGRRASGTAWLYRRTLFSPFIAVIASFAGIRRGLAVRRAARRLRRLAPRPAPAPTGEEQRPAA